MLEIAVGNKQKLLPAAVPMPSQKLHTTLKAKHHSLLMKKNVLTISGQWSIFGYYFYPDEMQTHYLLEF
jgi:hypothetical protein